MEQIASEYLDRLLGPLINPQKRIFVGYLLSALVIAVGVHLIVAKTTWRRAFSEVFARKVWLSKSAVADYKVLAINQLVMMGVAPRLLSKLIVATLLFETLHIWFDGRIAVLPAAPAWMVALAFTTVLFLLDDATKYLVHRALHRWPALWCFHKVHHSAETLTPLTVFRTHPMEAVIFATRAVLVQAICVAVFLFFFGDRASLVTILGANAFLFFFNLAGSNLRHSHIWISYGARFERWFISPAQHQIHHSIEERHFDRNFGAVLAIWDRIGGSLVVADPEHRPVAFGVEDGAKSPHSLRTLYLEPFLVSFVTIFAKARDLLVRLQLQRLPSWVRIWSIAGLVLLLSVAVLSTASQADNANNPLKLRVDAIEVIT